jgi:hypothetical protein
MTPLVGHETGARQHKMAMFLFKKKKNDDF